VLEEAIVMQITILKYCRVKKNARTVGQQIMRADEIIGHGRARWMKTYVTQNHTVSQ
jgi:hypothetical protein